MAFSPTDRLIVLTGAGISVESGLATFRGSGGLWNGYRVDQVATPEGLIGTPEQVKQRLVDFRGAGCSLVLLQSSPQHEEIARSARQVMTPAAV